MAVQERKHISGLFVLAVLLVMGKLGEVDAHGMILDPPGRGSMWRYGFDVPPDYDDNGLNCGGISVRYLTCQPFTICNLLDMITCHFSGTTQ